MAKIIARNKAYNGISAGVQFYNGVAECEDTDLISWFRNSGYEVEEVKRPEKPRAKKTTAKKVKEESAE